MIDNIKITFALENKGMSMTVFGLGREVCWTYSLTCLDKDQSACLFSFATFFISDSFTKNVKMTPLHSVMDFSV